MGGIRVVYEDDVLLAVSKPPGLAVHGGAGQTGSTLLSILSETSAHAGRGGHPTLHLAHRLDRGTSGVVLLAKSSDVVRRLAERWDRAKKSYAAVALGQYEGRIETPLKERDGRLVPALTLVRSLGELNSIEPTTSLLEIELVTGRMHQIRRHLAGCGHPVLMDAQYGAFAQNRAWSRAIALAGARKPKHLMLHECRLTIPHPLTDKMLVLAADPPEYWKEIVRVASGRVDLLEQLS